MEIMSINVILNEDECMYSDVCYSYWRLNNSGKFEKTVTEIAKEAGLSNNEILKIVRKHCRAYSNNIICTRCSKRRLLESRTSLQSLPTSCSWTCNECKQDESHSMLLAKINFVNSTYQRRLKNPVAIDKLGARLSIFLLALIKFCGDESMTHINEYSTNKTDLLSPDINYDLKIIEELFDAKLIAIDPESNMEAITISEDGKFSFNMHQVKWCVPMGSTFSSLASFYEALDDFVRSQALIKNNYNEVVSLCQEVSRIECLSYLSRVLAAHNLQYSHGKKTQLIISKALETFSVGQVYNFSWRAAKDAAAFYIRNRSTKDHAAKTVVGNIERQLEQAIANNWNIKTYRRNYDRPQSMLSRVLYNTLLRTDDGGFHQPLSSLIVACK